MIISFHLLLGRIVDHTVIASFSQHAYLWPAAGQFVEELFVQRLVHLFGAHRQEYVASDEFVYYFAIGRLRSEYYVALFKLYHHVFHFPVDVPRLNGQKKKKNTVSQLTRYSA